jgi:hypothetical protein
VAAVTKVLPERILHLFNQYVQEVEQLLKDPKLVAEILASSQNRIQDILMKEIVATDHRLYYLLTHQADTMSEEEMTEMSDYLENQWREPVADDITEEVLEGNFKRRTSKQSKVMASVMLETIKE